MHSCQGGDTVHALPCSLNLQTGLVDTTAKNVSAAIFLFLPLFSVCDEPVIQKGVEMGRFANRGLLSYINLLILS